MGYGLLFFGGLVLACCAFFSNAYTIKVVTEHAPPLQGSIDGKHSGCALARVKSLAREANIEIEIEFLPWARALNMALTRSNTLIFSMQRTRARESVFLWLAEVASIDVGLHRNIHRGEMTAEDLLNGKYTLALPRGDAFLEIIARDRLITPDKLLLTSTYGETVELFYKGKIDLLMGNLAILRALAQQQGRSGDEVVAFYPLPELNQVLYLAANLKLDPELAAKFRLAAQKIKQDSIVTSCP